MNRIKSLLKGSPVAMVVAGLVIAGVATAAYNFFTATATVTVEEAIIVSMSADDDMLPYMIPEGGVLPEISMIEDQIIIKKMEGVDGSEFTPGETLVIPINLRNRSDGALPLKVITDGVSESGLDVMFAIKKEGAWKTDWANPVYYTIAGHEGAFGSANESVATILFAKVHAPSNCPAGDKTFSLLFGRGDE